MGAGIIRIALSVHISKRGEDMAFVLGLLGGFYLGMVFMAILAVARQKEEDEAA